MSKAMSDRSTNVATGGIGLVFSMLYIRFASGIEDSLLADAVGASGVPVAIGALMAVASAALLLKALLQRPAPSSPSPEVSNEKPSEGDGSSHPHRLAAGLLLILALYLLVLPVLGYALAIGLMSAAVAWFAGGREFKVLLGFVLITGPLLWFLFDFALRVKMPTGSLFTIFAG
jgi:hypothetical protein